MTKPSVSRSAPDPLVLTDDELVALVASSDAGWPGGVATVAPEADAVGFARFRGARSLLVRGLVDDGGAPTGDAAIWRDAVLGATGHIGVYLADRQFRRASWAGASSHYVNGSHVLLEVTTPLGVHRLSEQPAADHRAYLEALLSAARDHGPEATADQAAPEYLCLLAQGAGYSVLAAAKRDRLATARVELTDDGVDVLGSFEVAESPQVVDRLFAAAGVAL